MRIRDTTDGVLSEAHREVGAVKPCRSGVVFRVSGDRMWVIGRVIGAVAAAAAMVGMAAPEESAITWSARASECPDVQVVFARGTGEPAGVGPTGEAFVASLRPRVGTKSVEVYPVDYPASDQWATGIYGIRDAGAHVVSMAGTCPKTKMVLGGYSQGAAVMGFVTSAAIPNGVDPATVPKPLAPEVADHVAAVVLFALPNVRAMNFLGEPPVVIGPAYQAKTLKVCAFDDAVCSDGLNFAAHDTYTQDVNLVNQGADFAATGLRATASGQEPTPPAWPPDQRAAPAPGGTP
jgi:cutinase